jgi:hypothetical protein
LAALLVEGPPAGAPVACACAAAAAEVIDLPIVGLVVALVTTLRPGPRVARRADVDSFAPSRRDAAIGSLPMLANWSAAPLTDSKARLGSKPFAKTMASNAATPARLPHSLGDLANRRTLILVPSSRPTQITDALRRSVSCAHLLR